MQKRKLFLISLLCLLVVDVVVYLFHIGGQSHDLLRNVLFLLGQLVTITGGIYAMREYGLSNPTGKTVAFLTCGFILWALGSLTYVINTFFLGIDQYPSLADVFIIAGYFFYMGGLLLEVRKRHVSFKNPYKIVTFITGLIIAVVTFYFGFYLAIDPSAPWLVSIVSLGYGIGDVILLMTLLIVIMMAFEYKGGRLFLPWFLIFTGFLVILVADILFTFYVVQYEAKEWPYYVGIDFIWRVSYVFFAYGLFSLGFVVKDVKNTIAHKIEQEVKK